MTQPQIITADITTLEVDAIVNAANAVLAPASAAQSIAQPARNWLRRVEASGDAPSATPRSPEAMPCRPNTSSIPSDLCTKEADTVRHKCLPPVTENVWKSRTKRA